MIWQREQFDTWIEMARFGSAELDKDQRFVRVNESFVTMLGVSAQGLVGKHWTVTIHPDDHHLVREAYAAAQANRWGYTEARGVRADSSVIYQAVTVRAIRDEQNELIGFACLRYDLSSYKRNQEALRLAVESAPSGLLMLNAEGEIQFVNRAVEKLFGYTREELTGSKVEVLLPERFRGLHMRHRDTFNRSESMKAMAGRDLAGRRKDGVEIPLQVYLNRIEAGSGELILCTIIDIAERVQYEKQLELAKQGAEAANRAKSDFLARMSHEIRTPMNLIMGMNALLLQSSLDEKQRQHVEISYRNVTRLLRLINGILDLSKVEAGELTLRAVPFDLSEVLTECGATIASAVEQKGLLLEMSVAPGVWRFWRGDSERLQQILLNLLGNSVKFTAHGKIDVRVSTEFDERGHSGLRFEVNDTGCGVPADKTGMIFEAFQQAEGSMNRPFEGTGLGLSISKTLAGMMSGKIWIEEKDEPGARFVFTAFFPPSSEQEVRDSRSVANTDEVEPVEPGTRVLLAEDNPENVILLQAYLEGVPITLDVASNGAEALEKRKQREYNVVLMDVQMPVMDGLTATKEIRAWERARAMRRIPIIALTAHALSGSAENSARAGCDLHITKPVERKDLIAAIAKYGKGPVQVQNKIPASIASLRSTFLGNRHNDLGVMKESLDSKDFVRISKIAHNCKGIGTGYGFPQLSKLAAVIEAAAKVADPTAVEVAIGKFEESLLLESPQ